MPEGLRPRADPPRGWLDGGGTLGEWTSLCGRVRKYWFTRQQAEALRRIAMGVNPRSLRDAVTSGLGASPIPDAVRDKATEIIAASHRPGRTSPLSELEIARLREVAGGFGESQQAVNLVAQLERKAYVTLDVGPQVSAAPSAPEPGIPSLWND